jgi:UDP-N-acetylmuramyl tripeptide synthase
MGKVAADLADVTIVTSDNAAAPRPVAATDERRCRSD